MSTCNTGCNGAYYKSLCVIYGGGGLANIGINTSDNLNTILSKIDSAFGTTVSPVSSVFGRTGDIIAQSGDYNASQVTHAADTSLIYSNPSWISSLDLSKITGFPSQTGNNGKILSTDGSTLSWINNSVGTVTSVNATAGTGISITGAPITTSGTLNIVNTLPDQTVVLNNGTGISITGTYPNFTITNTSPSSGGTVTNVSASLPISSSGGTTPNISISQASTSTNGYLSSSDWNTFNNKQSAISLGTTSQYFRGDLSLATFPTNISSFTNDSGYITSSSISTLTNKSGNISQWTNNSGYLTANQSITLSGEVSGTGSTSISTTVSNSAVIGKVLTGYISGAGTISATDSLLSAIQKLNGNISALTTGVSSVNGGTGAVTLTVTGTTNKIDVSGGTGLTPTITISPTYIGQSSITTLGTITTGVWNGTAIANANLANSTISGISLGSNLTNLSISAELIAGGASTYNGSVAKSIGIQPSSVTNSMLANSSVTINGNSVSLGGSTTITASVPNALTVGTGLQLNTGTTFDGSAAKTISIDGTVATLSGAQALTNKDLTGAGNTFPTFNQNTTGSAASVSISGQTGLLTFTGLASTNRTKTVRDAADTILELGGSYTPTGTWTSLTMVTPVLGTPTSGTLTNCTGLPTAGLVNNAVTQAKTAQYNAHTIWGNSTSSTANAADVPFYNTGQQTYAGTETWAGTPPSGAENKTYNWVRIGNMVILTISVNYAVAGATNTTVTFTLPTDCPNPLNPTGLGAANTKVYTGFGYIDASLTGNPPATRVTLAENAGANGWVIGAVAGSQSALCAQVTVIYFTA